VDSSVKGEGCGGPARVFHSTAGRNNNILGVAIRLVVQAKLHLYYLFQQRGLMGKDRINLKKEGRASLPKVSLTL